MLPSCIARLRWDKWEKSDAHPSHRRLVPCRRPRDQHSAALSSPLSNVLWGFANLVAAWALFTQVGAFDLADQRHFAAAAAGGLFSGVFLARHFGSLHGSDKGY